MAYRCSPSKTAREAGHGAGETDVRTFPEDRRYFFLLDDSFLGSLLELEEPDEPFGVCGEPAVGGIAVVPVVAPEVAEPGPGVTVSM